MVLLQLSAILAKTATCRTSVRLAGFDATNKDISVQHSDAASMCRALSSIFA